MPEPPQTEATDKRLFEVTISRKYTDEWRARWPSQTDYETTGPRWATSPEEIRAAFDAQPVSDYWRARYTDSLTAVVEVSPEETAERRERAARHPERCCDLAVLRHCVCRVSFACPLHGAHCHGSHD